jgi:tetratricopeptide (TPR) repeat protein
MSDILPTEPMRDGDAGAPPQNVGRFEVLRVIGAGGMGVVLAARDPTLDRKVALKLMRPHLWAAGGDRAELGREAQAMARLAHPNVVAVHEVGSVGDQTFIAMELVEGTTLRGWLDAQPRPWREVVAMLVAAGRGLAAAHAAGLVHRDFKPDNVLVGADGRPRVSDFGLVVPGAGPVEVPVDATAATSRIGTTAGTPAYMSPEQWAGTIVDARSDQFSFCVAAWEALYGRRPFAGDTPGEIGAAVRIGAITEPPADRPAPRSIATALRRGLAPAPADRWPDLAALLAELERALGGRRRGVIVAAAAGGAVLATVLVLALRPGGSDEAACPPPADRTAALWGPARKDALAAHLGAIDPAQGDGRARAIDHAVGPAAGRWSAAHVEACRATRDGRQSAALLDRRMQCLDRALARIDASVRVIEAAATPIELDRAVAALDTLPDLGVCADVARLADLVAAPADPAARRTYDELDRALADLAASRVAGRYDGLTATARALVERARAGRYPDLVARALDELSRMQHLEGAYEDELATLRALVPVAAENHDDYLVAQTWLQMVSTTVSGLDKPKDAEPMLLSAETAVVRAGNPLGLRYDLLEHRGLYHRVSQDLDAAKKDLDAGIALLLEGGARDPGSPLLGRLASAYEELGNVHDDARRWAEAIAAFESAIAARTEQYGPDHPQLLMLYTYLSGAYMHLNRNAESIAAIKHAAAIAEARMTPSPRLATIISRVGSLLTFDRQPEAALPYYARGIAMARVTMAADDLRLAGMLDDYGAALTQLHQFDAAREQIDAMLAVYAKLDKPSPNWAYGFQNRALVHVVAGEHALAIPWLEKSHAMLVETLGEDTPETTHLGMMLARSHLKLRNWDASLAASTRVLAARLTFEESGEQTLGRMLHGMALVESGRDKKRGLREVQGAYIEMLSPDVNTGPETLAEAKAWLEKHGGI